MVMLISMLVGVALLAHATPILSYDFNSLSAGNLAGQDSWVVLNSAASPVITTAPAPNSSPGVAKSSVATITQVKNSSLFTAGSVSASSVLTLSMDVYVAAGGATIDVFGIGGPLYGGGPNPSAWFGILGGYFAVRAENNGTVTTAQKSGGGSMGPATANNWYTLKSVWDLSAKTATLSYKNLTAGDAEFTTCYFDAAQTVKTASIAGASYITAPSLWDTAYIRTGNSSVAANSVMDKLNVIPEPATQSGKSGLSVLR